VRLFFQVLFLKEEFFMSPAAVILLSVRCVAHLYFKNSYEQLAASHEPANSKFKKLMVRRS